MGPTYHRPQIANIHGTGVFPREIRSFINSSNTGEKRSSVSFSKSPRAQPQGFATPLVPRALDGCRSAIRHQAGSFLARFLACGVARSSAPLLHFALSRGFTVRYGRGSIRLVPRRIDPLPFTTFAASLLCSPLSRRAGALSRYLRLRSSAASTRARARPVAFASRAGRFLIFSLPAAGIGQGARRFRHPGPAPFAAARNQSAD